jgi:hypothetical protein
MILIKFVRISYKIITFLCSCVFESLVGSGRSVEASILGIYTNHQILGKFFFLSLSIVVTDFSVLFFLEFVGL